MRHSYQCVFRTLDHDFRAFETIDGFLAGGPQAAGCLCIDVDGLDKPLTSCLRLIGECRSGLPVVLLVGALPEAYRRALGRLYAPLQILTKPVSGRRLPQVARTLSGRQADGIAD